jgi:23S rRNA (guanosine2251-2'-O)-methyltransferase
LFISRSEDKRGTRIKNLAKTSQVNSELIDSKKIDRLAGHSKHQGFAAEISNLGFLSEKDLIPRLKNLTTSRVLILDSIQDPRNLGACLRSALAFEFKAVIINKDGSSPINEYVFKTSVGAILNLNIFYVTNLSRSINTLKDIGFWVLGLDGHGEGSIFSEKFSSKTAVVLGSEGSGIRKLVKENCDHLIKIPISKKVESLNISVAAGIIMYELKKQHIN